MKGKINGYLELPKLLISLATSFFVAASASAILLIATVERNTTMVPVWDIVLIVSLILGFVSIGISIVIIFYNKFKKR